MSMTVSVNNQSGVPYVQYGTDRQKAKAAKFAKANDNDITVLAAKITNRKDRDNKLSKNIARTVAGLPLIAGAAAAITTKGKVSVKTMAAAKRTLGVGLAMGAIGTVINANNAIAAKNPKVNKAEKKHPLLTLAGLTAVATGVVTGGEALLGKISPKVKESVMKIAKKDGVVQKLNKVKRAMNNAPAAVEAMASKVASKVSLPKGVKENIAKVADKVKMPQILKDGYNKVANAKVTKDAANIIKKTGKAALKNPITATAAVVVGLSVAHAVKLGIKANQTKAQLKEAQLKTANNLIDAYAKENESLKTANAGAAEALEKSNSVIAEDADKNDEA